MKTFDVVVRVSIEREDNYEAKPEDAKFYVDECLRDAYDILAEESYGRMSVYSTSVESVAEAYPSAENLKVGDVVMCTSDEDRWLRSHMQPGDIGEVTWVPEPGDYAPYIHLRIEDPESPTRSKSMCTISPPHSVLFYNFVKLGSL